VIGRIESLAEKGADEAVMYREVLSNDPKGQTHSLQIKCVFSGFSFVSEEDARAELDRSKKCKRATRSSGKEATQ
jgi:hypothetical protein